MSRLLCLAAFAVVAVGCSAGTVGISDVKAEEKATAERIRQAGGIPPADERAAKGE